MAPAVGVGRVEAEVGRVAAVDAPEGDGAERAVGGVGGRAGQQASGYSEGGVQ